MSTTKVAEAMHLRRRIHRGGNDALKPAAYLRLQGLDQRVSRFADRDHQDAPVRVEIVKVLADPQDAAFAVHVASEGLGDGSLLEGVLENLAGSVAHEGIGFGGHDFVRVTV